MFSDQMGDLGFPGCYRAIVEDDLDPLEAGRVKVRVMPMMENVATDDLPWAQYCDRAMGGSYNVGSITIPPKNTNVWVFFENGDHRYPVYFGGAPAKTKDGAEIPERSRVADGVSVKINEQITNARKTGVSIGAHGSSGGTWDEPASAYAAKYPHNDVIASKGGIIIEMDNTPNGTRLHIFHPSGTRSEVDKDGNKNEHVTKDHTVVILGKKQVYVDSTYDINAADKVRIKSGEVILDADVWVTKNLHVEGNTWVEGQTDVEGNIVGHAEVEDSVRKMSEDRDIYNKHKHPGVMTGTASTAPTAEQQ